MIVLSELSVFLPKLEMKTMAEEGNSRERVRLAMVYTLPVKGG